MILLIDNYDSFVYNLYQFIAIGLTETNELKTEDVTKKIKVIRNNELTINEIKSLNPEIIILSPGPGKPEDAGICSDIIKEFFNKIPILGVCLGHQVICQTFGGEISYANKIMHGKTSKITHNNDVIFENIGNNINVARYHSLALVKESLPDDLEIISKTFEGEIMAVKHKEYPVYGLQFHPESILTEKGLEIITNFVKNYTN